MQKIPVPFPRAPGCLVDVTSYHVTVRTCSTTSREMTIARLKAGSTEGKNP